MLEPVLFGMSFGPRPTGAALWSSNGPDFPSGCTISPAVVHRQQQRVAVARALAHRPKLVPLTNLRATFDTKSMPARHWP